MRFPYLKPTWYQLPSWYARSVGKKRHLLSLPRRHGKDVCHFSMAVQDAIITGGVHYYAFPTEIWAKEVIAKEQFEFDGEKRLFWEWIIPKSLNVIWKEKDACFVFPKNNARIQLCGTDDESNVGRGGSGYTISEFSIHKPTATAFLAPIIRQSNGYMRLNGTIRGRNNQLWDMIQKNMSNPEWHVQWLRPHQTKCYCWVGGGFNINPELVDRIGQIGPNFGEIFNVQSDIDSGITTKSMAMQEYLNEPVIASENGYYENELAVAKGEKRIGSETVRYDRSLPVFTFWDLGRGTSYKSTDSMACWFVQVPYEDYENPKQVNLIDYHESIGKDWGFYAQMLNSKGYWYGGHYAPWDIQKGMAGHEKTNHDYARERGINFRTVKRGERIALDIEDVRRFFPKIWSGKNDSVVKGMELIAGYHQKLDKNNVPTGAPEHDHSSNCSDSIRTMVRAFVTKTVFPDSSGGYDFRSVAKNLSMSGFFDRD